MSLGGEHTDLFIGGQWRAASAAGRIDVVNPATEEVWASVPDADAADAVAFPEHRCNHHRSNAHHAVPVAAARGNDV